MVWLDHSWLLLISQFLCAKKSVFAETIRGKDLFFKRFAYSITKDPEIGHLVVFEHLSTLVKTNYVCLALMTYRWCVVITLVIITMHPLSPKASHNFYSHESA